jgi:hypothetical protein
MKKFFSKLWDIITYRRRARQQVQAGIARLERLYTDTIDSMEDELERMQQVAGRERAKAIARQSDYDKLFGQYRRAATVVDEAKHRIATLQADLHAVREGHKEVCEERDNYKRLAEVIHVQLCRSANTIRFVIDDDAEVIKPEEKPAKVEKPIEAWVAAQKATEKEQYKWVATSCALTQPGMGPGTHWERRPVSTDGGTGKDTTSTEPKKL